MSDAWARVDQYVTDTIVQQDDALIDALRESAAAGLPPISVSAPQGKLLMLLARAQRARSILEVGTLGGYSTIWLARALPSDGQLVTLELDAKHAAVARRNVDRAGIGGMVEIIEGRAIETLPTLLSHPAAPFDLVFIDADKATIPEYFGWALRLTKSGSVIIVDNVVRNGALADPDSRDANVQGVRTLHDLIAGDSRVSATTIQTVGAKQYDGFTLILVN
ncbi:MAG TPA: O-methyltransferase [Gemmatimonadales bacterium]